MRNFRPTENLLAASGDDANPPRRYFPNGEGHRVIVGLTPDETSEFEALERGHRDLSATPDEGRTMGAKRWRELYAKHATAWDAWMRASRVGVENRL